jgi:phosphohistidine phosphatase
VVAHLQRRLAPAAIWTSPLVRAVQTAEIIAEAAGLTGEVAATAELVPGHEAREMVERLAVERGAGPLALVGHEPLLSQLVTTLIADPTFAGIKKSGVVAVTWSGKAPASLKFVLDPQQID